MQASETENRVLVLAPAEPDALAIGCMLAAKGFESSACAGAEQTCREASAGAGALVLTEESLELPHINDLFQLLRDQPPWSELPLIILTRGGESRLVKLLDIASMAAGSITLLERPISARTLLRSVEVALRSRRRQYQMRDLLAAKAQLASIVESSEDAIISKDLSGIILTWNRGAQRLFGYSAAEAIGQSITMLIPPERLDEETKILNSIRNGRSVDHFETVRRRKDGRLVDISLTVSPIRGIGGKVMGASKVARDITSRKKAEKQLLEAQARLREHAGSLEQTVAERTTNLREINEQLEAFVYSIAHDLRAPLRAMSAYSQLLQEEHARNLNGEGQHLLQRIQRSSEFMDQLLMDLLAYGRVARTGLHLTPVNLRKAWDRAVFQCTDQIGRSGAEIKVSGQLPAVLAHDATLTQCLANLLSNATKFTRPGVKPRIYFWAERRGDRVRLWVEDNGIGIPEDQHERIFRVFERLHGSRYPGTGIGLSIVRKGIERMGGSVGLKSTMERGSSFWLDLSPATGAKSKHRRSRR